VGAGAAYQPATILRPCQIAVDELGEEALRPMRVGALVGVNLLGPPPYPRVVFLDRHLKTSNALVRNVENVLGIVQEGNGVVVRSQEEDLAVKLDETLERRAPAESIVPGLGRDEIVRLPSPDHEASDVRVDARSRVGAEELDEGTVAAVGARGQRIERGELREDLPLLLGSQVSAPHLVVVSGATRVHEQRTRGG
jgi:hypothetical protein